MCAPHLAALDPCAAADNSLRWHTQARPRAVPCVGRLRPARLTCHHLSLRRRLVLRPFWQDSCSSDATRRASLWPDRASTGTITRRTVIRTSHLICSATVHCPTNPHPQPRYFSWSYPVQRAPPRHKRCSACLRGLVVCLLWVASTEDESASHRAATFIPIFLGVLLLLVGGAIVVQQFSGVIAEKRELWLDASNRMLTRVQRRHPWTAPFLATLTVSKCGTAMICM